MIVRNVSQVFVGPHFRKSPWIGPPSESLRDPGCDPAIEQTERNKGPGNADRHYLQIASGRPVAGRRRTRTEEFPPVTPKPGASEQIDDKKQRSGDSQCRKS